MLATLPYELVLDILRGLSVQDLLNVRRTCKELHVVTQDSALWNHVLSGILSLPLSCAVQIGRSLWHAPPCRRAVIAARVDKNWHDTNIIPRHIRFLPTAPGLEDVVLLPGGEWLVSLYHDGSLELQAVNGCAHAFRLATGMNPADLTSQGSRAYMSPAGDIMLVYALHTGVHVYRVNLSSTNTTVELVDDVPAAALPGFQYTGRVFVGGNIMVLLYMDPRGLSYLDIRSIPENHDSSVRQARMHIAIEPDDAIFAGFCTMQIISPDRLVLSTYRRIYMYAIPQLTASPPGSLHDAALTEPIWSEPLHAVHPGETSACYGSPVAWNGPRGRHTGALMLWRPCRVFVLEPSADLCSCALKSYPAPYGAQHVVSGVRRGCYTTNFPRDGLLVNLYTFTDVDDGAKRPAVSSFSLGPGAGNVIVLGSSLDEWSGRICLHIEDSSWVRSTYTVLVDVA